ncbi:hypothetical protein [Pseudolactococcus insecticola]|uniref:Uncharacterized protein n=1 Tax=Pseudolactococcus insecticola TaxID=2709158 RepID=A0A6A0BAD8_9LACT|nr:hypothetical protein [Lactococcus insecticola]GFH41418.1 hypothetical protein Hs20B_18160 [Lactococcus insecticola]
MIEQKYNEQAKCPACGSENVEYGSIEFNGEGATYEVSCEDCNINFMEWYDLVFAGNEID